MAVKDILDHFRDRFIDEMVAIDVVVDLLHSGIISEGDKIEITRITNPTQQNQTLHLILKKTCTDESFRKACDVISEVQGNPKLRALGVDMKKRLERGSDAVSTVGAPPIIPDIMDDYIEVKEEFIKVCTAQGSPTLDEVKRRCINLIKVAQTHIPLTRHYEDDIIKVKTMEELASVVCFDLSKWISYDFFRKVIAHFQPALRSVKEQLTHYEDQLKPLLQQKLQKIAQLQKREKVPGNMAELTVKYRLDADGLLVKDLVAGRDFLAQRLGIPEHLLQVLSWEDGSIMIIYWIVRDALPLAELALCREGVRAELTQHGVEAVYLGYPPSKHLGPVEFLQTLYLQRCAIVTVLDAHHEHLDVTSLASDLKSMGILTAEQCQKLASLDDKGKRHEALLYTLLACIGPHTYHNLVECMRLRDLSVATDLQATFKDFMTSPSTLSVISSSQDYSGNHVPIPAASGVSPPYSTYALHGQSCDGMESPPMPQPPLFEGYNCPIVSPSIQPSIPYPLPQPVKDKAASKASRKRRRSKVSRKKHRSKLEVKDLSTREVVLVAENSKLKTTIESLESEIAVFREKVVQRLGMGQPSVL